MPDSALTFAIVQASEAAAIAAARLRGHGDEQLADEMAATAMHDVLNGLDINATVVIGTSDGDGGGGLQTGKKIGRGKGVKIDLALDPLEGATPVAKFMANALSVLVMADPDSLLKVPDSYMDKIAVGADLPAGIIDIDNPPAQNLANLAKSKGVAVEDLTVCILDRPRNGRIIEQVRKAGAAVNLIPDGDIAGVFHAANPDDTGIDMYLGSGGAPEGVLAAAALRCIGGQMQARLVVDSRQQHDSAEKIMGRDPTLPLTIDDMVKGQVLFAATGITDGTMLNGVRMGSRRITTHTVVMCSQSGTVRWLRTRRKVDHGKR